MDAADGIYLPPKSLPKGGWTRPAGLIFRRRACRREDGHGRRGLSSAEELAGGRREDGHGLRGLSSAEELAEAGGER